jgi:protein-glutamine gamma-glutamyltransferase
MMGHAHPATRFAVFAALAVFAAVHWSGMVDPAPAGRLVLSAAVAAAGGLALIGIGRLGLGRAPTGALAAACGVLTVVAGLATVGVAPGLLLPTGWEELGRNLDTGLAGLAGDVEYPYRDGAAWSRLAILSVAPLALGLAATLAFWPARERGRRLLGVLALVLLVALYAAGIAVTSPDGGLIRGVLLLALVGAWLWLPALRWRDALVATALVAAAGALAVPAAAQLRGDPWLNYKNWTLRAAEGATYSWGHSYGPIDWPRFGTQRLAVASRHPHYWKAAVLDRFNGVRWMRSDEASLGARDVSDSGRQVVPPGSDPRWIREFTVAIHDLKSDLVIASGTPIRIIGVEDASTAPDGTTVSLGESLGNGDSYTVRAYIPDPTADEMRAAPQEYPRELAEHTMFELPAEVTHPGAPSEDGGEVLPVETVVTQPEGPHLNPNGVLEGPATWRIERSPYAEVLALTRRLTQGQPTVYDAVRAVHDHLRNEYEYSEFPPRRTHPLASFLLDDRRGYCQQFSGAMALMLRMAGIPSRVVSGFAPGRRTEDGEGFIVDDFEAHAWVEVYFNEIGWVAFDPTPAAAPVATQQVPGLPTSEVDEPEGGDEANDGDEDVLVPVPTVGGPGGSINLAPLAGISGGLLLALLGGTALVAMRARRHRHLAPGVAAEAQLEELARALERLGWSTSGGATLLSVERALRRARRRSAARYVEHVRALRYGGEAGRPPSLAERRAVRRELSSGRGPLARLRALAAIPPGGPRLRPARPPVGSSTSRLRPG